MAFRSVFAALAILTLFGCTDAGLYASNAKGSSAPDRATFEGRVCVPPATGDAFPVKVLFAIQGGQGVSPEIVGNVVTALNDVSGRFTVPYITFSLVAYHTVATGLAGGFVAASPFQAAVVRYGSYQEQGPVSLRAPLKLAKGILSGDMQSSCQGTVSRTRYLVVLVVVSGDTSCNNPAFNAGLDGRCTLLLPDSVACSQCELTAAASELKALADTYRAGEVRIQPVYVRDAADLDVAAEVAAIAKAGGTEVIQTTPANLGDALNGINYTSLQRELALKRLIAFNRNVMVRAGAKFVDSDGDGVSDEDEIRLGLDPVVADSDGDGIMDGLELKMGLDPLTGDTLTGCNPFLDSDGDRINDCEERVLGTNNCQGDTDADGAPDLVEGLIGTNPLVPEDLADDDGDGQSNIAEIERHTDPRSADLAFAADHAYGYQITDADPTSDGRACYDIRVDNIELAATLAKPNAPFPDIPAGTNEIYLYMEAGRRNDPRGAGVSSLHVSQLRFTPPATRVPSGVIQLAPGDFNLGI